MARYHVRIVGTNGDGCILSVKGRTEWGTIRTARKHTKHVLDNARSFGADHVEIRDEFHTVKEHWAPLEDTPAAMHPAPLEDTPAAKAKRAALVERAREVHGSEEIEIDDTARISEGDGGSWVQAWVWVADNEGV